MRERIATRTCQSAGVAQDRHCSIRRIVVRIGRRGAAGVAVAVIDHRIAAVRKPAGIQRRVAADGEGVGRVVVGARAIGGRVPAEEAETGFDQIAGIAENGHAGGVSIRAVAVDWCRAVGVVIAVIGHGAGGHQANLRRGVGRRIATADEGENPRRAVSGETPNQIGGAAQGHGR